MPTLFPCLTWVNGFPDDNGFAACAPVRVVSPWKGRSSSDAKRTMEDATVVEVPAFRWEGNSRTLPADPRSGPRQTPSRHDYPEGTPAENALSSIGNPRMRDGRIRI